MDAAHLIVAERREQILKGYDIVHDNLHWSGELLFGALAYLCCPGDVLWPWEPETYKPSVDPVRNIVKAGALIAAEGDRLLRRREAGLPVVGGLIVLGQDVEEILATVDGLQKIRNDAHTL